MEEMESDDSKVINFTFIPPYLKYCLQKCSEIKKSIEEENESVQIEAYVSKPKQYFNPRLALDLNYAYPQLIRNAIVTLTITSNSLKVLKKFTSSFLSDVRSKYGQNWDNMRIYRYVVPIQFISHLIGKEGRKMNEIITNCKGDPKISMRFRDDYIEIWATFIQITKFSAEVGMILKRWNTKLNFLKNNTLEMFKKLRRKFPRKGDIVIVKIIEFSGDVATVELLEYNRIRAIINSKRFSALDHVTTFTKFMNKKGKFEVMRVKKSQPQEMIKLTLKKKIETSERQLCFENFKKSQKVDNIVKCMSNETRIPSIKYLSQIVWKMLKYESNAHKSIIYDKFKAISLNNSLINDCNINSKYKEELLHQINLRFINRFTSIAQISIKCFTERGIGAIKEALLAGRSINPKYEDVNIKYEKSQQTSAFSLFTLRITTIKRDQGIKALNLSISLIESKIIEFGGSLVINTPPKLLHYIL